MRISVISAIILVLSSISIAEERIHVAPPAADGPHTGPTTRTPRPAAPEPRQNSANNPNRSSGEWLDTRCGHVYVMAPTEESEAFHVYAHFNNEVPDKQLQYCFDGETACDAAQANGEGESWADGEPNMSEDHQPNTVKSFTLTDGHYTVLSVRGTLADGKACRETLRIERQSDTARVDLIDDKNVRLETAHFAGDETPTPSAAEEPQPRAARTPGTASGGEGTLPTEPPPKPKVTLKSIFNFLKGRGWDSNRNGVADRFDGDVAGPGNMCNEYAVRACSELVQKGIDCKVVWFNLNSAEKHAVVKVKTDDGWKYLEPQLNRQFGLPTPGSVYAEFDVRRRPRWSYVNLVVRKDPSSKTIR